MSIVYHLLSTMRRIGKRSSEDFNVSRRFFDHCPYEPSYTSELIKLLRNIFKKTSFFRRLPAFLSGKIHMYNHIVV
jgi:hypothetical protein